MGQASPIPKQKTPAKAAQNSQDKATTLRMTLVGGNPNPRIQGLDELPGKVNYFRGKDPKQWQTNIPTYAKAKYEKVYPGIDLIYYGNGRQLEYDFIVAPGADPKAIRLNFSGADKVRLDAAGDLLLHTPDGELRLHKPVIYQTVAGKRQNVEGRFVLHNLPLPQGEGRGEGKHKDPQIGFQVAAYDASQTLVIDPVLVYSSYLGGSGNETDYGRGPGIAVDSAGNAYITGYTTSSDFLTVNAIYSNNNSFGDAFVTKLNADGTQVLYSTYLGGSSFDEGVDIAVDNAGNSYVTGVTSSSNFPIVNAKYPNITGDYGDAFVTKLNASGSQLLYSTFLGGSGEDEGHGIGVDSLGSAYVTGYTRSSDFPAVNAKYPNYGGGTGGNSNDVFMTKFNASGSQVLYSTYLGGSGNEFGMDIAVDSAGNSYVTGFTTSSNFPTVNAKYPQLKGGSYYCLGNEPSGCDAFVSKFNSTGSELLYSTFLGGSNNDYAYGIAVDGIGNAYVIGYTSSSDFPTMNAKYPNLWGSSDAFVTKLNSTGTEILYSTYLGGSGDEYSVGGIAVDSAGNAYVTGTTTSSDFPVVNARYPNLWGRTDAFVTKFNASGSEVLYSTYLGGSNFDDGIDIAVDSVGNVYGIGFTGSSDFPTHANDASIVSFDPDFNGGDSDAFVVKISDTAPPPPPPPVLSITQSPLSGSPGKLFVQWGDGFSPNTTATLHFTKPDGTEYPTQQQSIDANGHFGINYKIPDTKPAGTYTWWAVDSTSGKKSPVITYQITPLINVAKIYGKLHINSASGAALSGAKVSTGIVATTTARNGSFSLAKIPAGDQVINFSKSGYQPFSTTIRVPASGSYNMGNRWLVRNGLVKPTIA